jgi:hypothetical protein
VEKKIFDIDNWIYIAVRWFKEGRIESLELIFTKLFEKNSKKISSPKSKIIRKAEKIELILNLNFYSKHQEVKF